jgi:magnesium chelatase family protein
MCPAEIRQCCELDETGQNLIRSAMSQLQLSELAYHCILKLAHITTHLAEALQYRSKVMLL